VSADPRTVPLPFVEYPVDEMIDRARRFRDDMARRRTVREFSDRSVPREVVTSCLAAAASAPSGANLQPWHFAVVARADTKRRIREGAEKEEREFYERRASQEWLAALAPLGTDSNKPFLERAPLLIVVFEQTWGYLPDGRRVKHYYPKESVGLATGILIAALHRAGLASLTHTRARWGFLNEILGRPKNERPFLLLVVGYPEEGARVPDIRRKPLDEVVSFDCEHFDSA